MLNKKKMIDTHRHLGGSIPTYWVWEVVLKNNWYYIGESHDDIIRSMTFSDEESNDFHIFLNKFKILDQIQWNEELIDSSIKEVCNILASEKIDFCWMDFSINKYMETMNWHKIEAIKFIHNSFQTYYPDKIGLILSLKYESTQASQRQYAQLIDDPEIVDILFGIDLVGDERHFDDKFYAPIFKQWNKAQKMTRAHASECLDWKNSYNAIKNLEVTNIAHGINLIKDRAAIEAAIENDITFDLGLTSNYLTGVCNKGTHPLIDMLKMGLKVTLGTDDPVQCECNLKGEYKLAKDLGVSEKEIKMMQTIAENNTIKFIGG